MRPSCVLALALVGCASSSSGQALLSSDLPQGVDLRPADDRPAPGPLPSPPGIERPADEGPPARTELPLDAARVGRLHDTGWKAEFDFEARAGEHSLFELTTWGFARGWTSRAALVVRDGSGRELARSERGGGTVYQDVLAFIAPEDGRYALELDAVENGFRFRVVHHAGYTAHAPNERLEVGRRDRVHSWIQGAAGELGGEVLFHVEGEPGAVLLLRAEPTDDRGLKQKRARRRALASAATGGIAPEALMRMSGRRGADDGSFPDLALEVEGALAGAAHARIVRVPESGALDVRVTRTNEGPPGRFDLVVQRGLEFADATIRVGDLDDEPVAGAQVALLLEPSLDLVARVTTGADGTASALVPPGDYTVVHSVPGARPETTRTRLAVGEALNLVAQ